MSVSQIRRSSKLIKIKGSAARTDRGTVDLLVEGDDGHDYGIEFDLPIIPAALTALTGHANELLATGSFQAQDVSQAMNVVDLDLSMSPKGDTSLTLVLQGNLKLHLTVPKEHSSKLKGLLRDLEETLDRDLQ